VPAGVCRFLAPTELLDAKRPFNGRGEAPGQVALFCANGPACRAADKPLGIYHTGEDLKREVEVDRERGAKKRVSALLELLRPPLYPAPKEWQWMPTTTCTSQILVRSLNTAYVQPACVFMCSSHC